MNLRSNCTLFSLAVLPGLGMVSAGSAAGMTLAAGGRTECVVVQAAEQTAADAYAVRELVEYLQRITGATFPVVTGAPPAPGPRIFVGPSAPSRRLLGAETVDALGAEEFVIRCTGQDLFLLGGRRRGTLYAVYHFLDNIVGVRWWAAGATFVPEKPNLRVDALDLREKPVFEYREVFLTSAWNADWAARNRLNGRVRRNPDIAEPVTPDAAHGGGVSYGSAFVHTFRNFIPREKYFGVHPEYFNLAEGTRARGTYDLGQLCLTNPEVLDLMVREVKAYIAQNPGVNIVSVSQNDGKNGSCRCVNCSRIDTAAGSPSGSLLRFVNAVAARIETEYPEVYVDTLAYQYTRLPPRDVRPRCNVIVRLCDIECSFAQPLEQQAASTTEFSKSAHQFADNLRDWAAITENLYVWDYIANFSNYFRPHPNLRVLGPNLRFFARNRVKGVFEQGRYMTSSGEMAELRSWVLARLLWNPEQDDRALVDAFVRGYYGAAAPFVREYLDLIHDAVAESRHFLSITASDPSPHVTPATMSRAEALFQQAEAAVAEAPAVLQRVRRAHMPVQCMWLVHYYEDAWSAQARREGSAVPAREQILAAFNRQVQADGVTLLAEGQPMSVFLDGLKDPAVAATVRASGFYGKCFPWNVFDGTKDAFWNSGGFGPQWIQKDMGRVVKVKSIRSIFGHGGWGVNYQSLTYKIEGSLDGRTWQLLRPEATTGTNEAEDVFSPPVETRFIRTTLVQGNSAKHPQGEWVGMSRQDIEAE